ncbi:Predicted kinase, aminoglycoside phosphotransferase (APT) family [Saccharopolyspora shandongensis]|uniref:Predicted kinase, aminoglycoside phosphotransferase (APT) family n=1 Tax=Saccharopolyspora shandongensis TaxID=418495 RepID=A0A1H3NSX9_9PSEU|nr:phosphotransferase family protein [Saccharopolyspora shandongensis]SDY92021.1 Predicted kinase, aminoglycoside phosphotransferase (APT) family [Saccharopolyspora shandongensis]
MELRGIELEKTERWLAENVPGLRPPVTFSLVSGGRSNLTYRVVDADGAVRALRRPPTGGVLTTAHDMSREWRFISALHGTDVPVPDPLAYCADASVTGAEFYVMGFVDGHVLAGPDSAASFSAEARRRAGLATVECMAALHGVDPDSVGLGDIARRDGYLERQLRRWQRQVHQSGAPDLPLLDAVHDALLAKVPRQETGIVHGDFRPGNLSFSPDGEVLAVFDWELATLGEPLADLGWLLATWVEPGDELPPATALGPTAEPGFPTRAELVDRYVALAGRDVSDLPYYVAFQRWRSCCISAGVRARYLAGVMGDDGYVAESRAKNELRQAEAAWQAVQELS